MGESGGFLHFEWARALQELLVAREDRPASASGSRIGHRRATLATPRTVGIDHGWGFDLRGQKLFSNLLSCTLALFLFLSALFFKKTLVVDQPFSVELGLEPLALRAFGMEVVAKDGYYNVEVNNSIRPTKPIVLIERGDTVTENALFAAARYEGTTIIRNASSNYMVQDLCFFLEKLGVQVKGIGTTTLEVTGLTEIDVDVEYSPSEDPIEAMSLIAAAVVTKSEITIRRSPIEFLEIELATLTGMGMQYSLSEEYLAHNGRTRLVDITTHPGPLKAPIDKIHPMPFPGLNIDNLPFFALIAACAEGTTTIHDWVYENRAIYLTELTKIGANVTLLDPHRVQITGPTRWRANEVACPPALRPGVVVLLAMLAAPGVSFLRNVYVINRGYEDLANRLNAVGANIEVFRD